MLLVSAEPNTRLSRPAHRALLVQSSSNLDGSAFSGLLVAKVMVSLGYRLHVGFRCDGPICDRYAAIGGKIHFVGHENWLGSRRVRGSVKGLMRLTHGMLRFIPLIRELRPALVYVNTIASLCAGLAGRLCGSAVILHLRELFDDVGGEMCWPAIGGRGFVRRSVLAGCDVVLAPSQAVVHNVLGRQTRRCHVVPNAVSSDFFDTARDQTRFRRRLGLASGGSFLVGVPGNLRPVKGHLFFLQAAARVARLEPNMRFAITGSANDPGYGQLLNSEVQRLGLAECTTFLGPVADMRDFYLACDAVCVPSRAESFGRTVVEAFACGVPVVATQVGGIPEIVDHEHTGLLVPYGDVVALADALVRLHRDAALRRRLAECAKAVAWARYHESVHARQIAEQISNLVHARTRFSATRVRFRS